VIPAAILIACHPLVRLVVVVVLHVATGADVAYVAAAAMAIEALAAHLLLLLRRVEAGRDGHGLVGATARSTGAGMDIRLYGHGIARLRLQQLVAVGVTLAMLLHTAAAIGVHK